MTVIFIRLYCSEFIPLDCLLQKPNWNWNFKRVFDAMYRLKGSRVKRDAVLCILLFFCRWSWSFICISKGQFTTWKIQRIISYILAFSGTPRIPQIDCTWILDKVLKENEELTPPWKEGLCNRGRMWECLVHGRWIRHGKIV